jgi:UDP-N-acetylmuramyl pentapeptide phosphotransferase/UDP-N-acetylglucosamine-1-phosphate transferase
LSAGTCPTELINMASAENAVLAVVAILAGLISAGLIIALMPLLGTYALARPNARSSHLKPTPQGGGIAVIVATLAAAWLGVSFADMNAAGASREFLALTIAATALAATGAVDDIRPLPVGLRLALQCAAVGLALAFIPPELRIIPELPLWIERAGLLLGGIWFVNLTNFMDGIDLMTVAETVPVAGVIILLGLLGVVPMQTLAMAVALLGAIIGFAPFNRPVARLFLGDVGSLPIGLLLAWLLFHVAASGHLVAAILLPLYYLADTTVTLVRRSLAHEPIWQAHRSHFYQRATDGGFSVDAIVLRVFLLNLGLGALAMITVIRPHVSVSAAALCIGAALVGMLLDSFARGRIV